MILNWTSLFSYFLTDAAGRKYVMRKRPPGKIVSPTQHQVDREFRIMKALKPTGFPVPNVLCLCRDPEVLGTDFFVGLWTGPRGRHRKS